MSNSLTLGIDLGGTKMALALVDAQGQRRISTRLPVGEGSPSKLIEDVRTVAAQWRADHPPPAAVGVGIAGQVEADCRTIAFAPNLRWRNLPFACALQDALGVPVLLLNDVRAAAYGEWQHGIGRGAQHLLCLFVGTGIGGALIAGGRMIEGAGNVAGELGHFPVVHGGRSCTCGHRGCLEAYAGGWALAEQARGKALQTKVFRGSEIPLALDDSDEGLSAREVIDAFRAGDPTATAIVELALSHFSGAMIGFVNAFNPEIVVLGGGVAQGLPELITACESAVSSCALPTPAKMVRFVAAALGAWSGAIGAASWARRQLSSTPSLANPT